MAEIKWLGHACFHVRSREATVLMDPVGTLSRSDQAFNVDIVTVSHQDANHSALDAVQPGYRVINGPGEYEIKDVFITGIGTYHDNEGGQSRGKNTVYLVEVEDLVICHLGDLGHALSEGQVERMNSVDVLLIPVGGGPTIDAEVAAEVIGQLEPSIVIPMQYRTEQGDQDRDPLDRFLKQLGAEGVEPQERLTIKKSDLGESMRVVVLQA